ncbi:hypothetical protein DSM112329_01770 [Paraconexibacter sp. AEG42_29]|uniref:DUF4878 domain-containing protein n=1 Tax=Paraconexibacter sp. AEG42_29 TaxID=2997339 RepID=A0AAU7ATX8_9ACTN
MPVSPVVPARTRRGAPDRRRGAVTGAGAAAATLLTGVLLAGCGSDEEPAKVVASPEVRVRTVVRQFGVASAAKDYQAICDRLIAKTLSDNVEELGLPCELAFKEGLESVRGASLRIDAVRFAGASKAFAKVHTSAVGQAPSDDTLELVLVGRSWRISSLNAPASSVPKPVQVKFW